MNRQRVKIIAVDKAFGLLDERVEQRYWVHPMINDREKSEQFKHFFENIRRYTEIILEYYQMSVSSFDELLKNLRPHITKTITTFRILICAEERLTILLL